MNEVNCDLHQKILGLRDDLRALDVLAALPGNNPHMLKIQAMRIATKAELATGEAIALQNKHPEYLVPVKVAQEMPLRKLQNWSGLLKECPKSMHSQVWATLLDDAQLQLRKRRNSPFVNLMKKASNIAADLRSNGSIDPEQLINKPWRGSLKKLEPLINELTMLSAGSCVMYEKPDVARHFLKTYQAALRAKPFVGLNYRIWDPEQTSYHYLVGIGHQAPKSLLKSNIVQNALLHADSILLEMSDGKNILDALDAQARPYGLIGIDSALICWAKEHGKPIRQLETSREQSIAFAQAQGLIPGSGRFKEFLEVLEQMSKNKPTTPTGELKDALYLQTSRSKLYPMALLVTGDITSFVASTAALPPCQRKHLMSERNRTWMNSLVPVFSDPKKRASAFVGATHLFGKDGLLELLQEKGFKVERILPDGGLSIAKTASS